MHLTRARNVIWFSTIGTRRARQFLAARPDAVAICHNDVMAGDIYVNHGLLQAAMRARGNYAWRMVRNPVHLYTAVRDRIRYRGRTHRAIVALTTTEAELLVSTFGKVRAPIHVIPNGVDIDRFRPPDTAERAAARAALGIVDDPPSPSSSATSSSARACPSRWRRLPAHPASSSSSSAAHPT